VGGGGETQKKKTGGVDNPFKGKKKINKIPCVIIRNWEGCSMDKFVGEGDPGGGGGGGNPI